MKRIQKMKRRNKSLSKAILSPLLQDRIANRIFFIRGKKVLLDFDLARLYGVETRSLNQAVRRNLDRFPPDFMFQLTHDETEILRSQIVISSWGGGRYLPYAFTEQGVAMLSSVLKSKKAIEVNIQIMRIFTKLREMMIDHKDLRQKIQQMERKYDNQFRIVFDAVKQLLERLEGKKEPMGFRAL